ncbi:glycerate kinase [Corynebacterium sp. sy039]|uniref:glycerate kinase n=1 Tax=Corynebacterium sp. sy039 TaxID=2599641 RepID=UPI0011B70701|nr:glycerate kinase [Corynebacterium sp. sy039]QDZ42856.1 glycerate kinase [Corynebacterium sp. sy039]
MHIIIAPDSLKGTATTHEAGQYLAQGVREELTARGMDLDSTTLSIFPMADGGEGTAALFDGQHITLPTTDAVGRLSEASYVFDESSSTAYIDVAAASGLVSVHDQLNPLGSDTFGTGVLIADAASRGATRIVLGLGGSATTDGGTGILVALGAQLLDHSGRILPQGGGGLSDIAQIDTAMLNIPAASVDWVLLGDVAATATGHTGTAHVYAPQKGADEQQVQQLEAGITALCAFTGIDPMRAGIGAAGGIPISILWLSALLHGTTDHVHLLPGARVIADHTGLSSAIGSADVVITAEGQYDAQSATGKVVGTIIELAQGADTRVAVAAGKFVDKLPEGVLGHTLADPAHCDVRTQLQQAGRALIAAFLDGPLESVKAQ